MIEFKKKKADTKDKFCGFTVKDADLKLIKRFAKKHEVSVSEYARAIVIDYIKNKEK
jgi:hypothetical protein